MKRQYTAVIALCCLLVSSFAFLGCEIGSSDSAVRNMNVNFSGLYDAKDATTPFVSPANSGALVTRLNLRQNGDQLEAIDNNDIVFRGTLNDPSGDSGSATAGFMLEGHTTAGNSVTISGTLSGSGTTAEMKGTWIEPDRYCNLLGDANINAIPTNTGTYTLTVNISPSNGVGTVSLHPSGGTYSSGASVELQAKPASNYKFSEWSGDLTGSTNPATIKMDGNKTITAKFTSL